jgi:hypothetical protein
MLKTVVFFLMFLPALIFAENSAEHSKGEKLLNRFWKDMKEGHVKAIKKYTSPQFQSEHWNGACNRAQELNLIANLNLTSYSLSSVKITEEHNVLIISYLAEVNETINNQVINSTSPRLTIFEKVHDKWKLVAHANLGHPIQ